MKVLILGNSAGLLVLLFFLKDLLRTQPGGFVNFLGMWAAFALMIGVLFLAACLVALGRRSFKLWLVLVAHLVVYVFSFERLVLLLSNTKNLHTL